MHAYKAHKACICVRSLRNSSLYRISDEQKMLVTHLFIKITQRLVSFYLLYQSTKYNSLYLNFSINLLKLKYYFFCNQFSLFLHEVISNIQMDQLVRPAPIHMRERAHVGRVVVHTFVALIPNCPQTHTHTHTHNYRMLRSLQQVFTTWLMAVFSTQQITTSVIAAPGSNQHTKS